MMASLSIRRQAILGVVLVGLLSVVCSAATYVLIANTLLHGHLAANNLPGQVVGAVQFRVRPPAGASGGDPRWLVLGVMLLLVFTPFIYIALFSYLFGWRFSRSISRPIGALVEAVRRIQAHDLDFQIDDPGHHEIGQLLRAFEGMRVDLHDALRRQWTLEAERRDMLEAISHDLRTPVAIIAGHAEMLLEMPALAEPAHRFAEAIGRNASRVVRLLEDFRTLTDIDNPQFTLAAAPVDLVSFLEGKLAEHERLAQARSVQLRIDVEDGRMRGRAAMIDADRLAQIIDNILVNAIRYTPAGGVIACAIRVADQECSLSVRDEGPGFDPRELDHVFRKFYRGAPSRNQGTGLAGLGMYIVGQLVDRMGGRISIGNDPVHGGAVVALHLPLVPADR